MQRELFPIESLVGQIFHARWGFNATNNTFIVVLQETDKTVVVAELKNQRLSGDIMNGTERPLTPLSDEASGLDGTPFRLQKKTSRDGVLFLQQDFKIFKPWDGQDKFYHSD